jgi:hypothetical protein
VHIGAWAFYVPDRGLKFLHAKDGKHFCIYKILMRQAQLSFYAKVAKRVRQAVKTLKGRSKYSAAEWDAALSKTVTRRVAENMIAAELLAAHGLGPQINCAVQVAHFDPWYLQKPTTTAGYEVQSAFDLPTKVDCTEAECVAAGVTPDKIKSCVRQQLNGYVTDLNSVVGVMPVGAAALEKVAQIEAAFGQA